MITHKPEPHRLTLPTDGPLWAGNCGVIAVALMAGVTHADALAALKIDPKGGEGFTRTGRRKSNLYSTCQWQRVKALEGLGLTVEQPVHRTDCRPRHRLAWWAKRLAWGRNYMVRVNKHVVVVRDGLVYDQHANGVGVERHFSRNQIVTDIAFVSEAA